MPENEPYTKLFYIIGTIATVIVVAVSLMGVILL